MGRDTDGKEKALRQMRKKGKWTVQKHYVLASEERPFQCVHEMLLVMLPSPAYPLAVPCRWGKMTSTTPDPLLGSAGWVHHLSSISTA